MQFRKCKNHSEPFTSRDELHAWVVEFEDNKMKSNLRVQILYRKHTSQKRCPIKFRVIQGKSNDYKMKMNLDVLLNGNKEC